MTQGALYGDPEVLEVDGFCDEVKCAAVHRRTDVFHVAVGGDHDGTDFGVNVGDLLQEGEAVHAGHVNVRKDHINIFVLVEACQGFIAIVSEDKFVLAAADVAAHTLEHEGLEVRFVVYYEDFVRGLHSHWMLSCDLCEANVRALALGLGIRIDPGARADVSR